MDGSESLNRNGSRRMVERIRAIKASIQDNGPRSGDGELTAPYRGWLKRLDADLAKWQAWVDGVTAGERPEGR
jgi:hypothetical protein